MKMEELSFLTDKNVKNIVIHSQNYVYQVRTLELTCSRENEEHFSFCLQQITMLDFLAADNN